MAYRVCIRDVYISTYMYDISNTSGSGEGRSEKPSKSCTLPDR